jgi:hypothetical protein
MSSRPADGTGTRRTGQGTRTSGPAPQGDPDGEPDRDRDGYPEGDPELRPKWRPTAQNWPSRYAS